MNIPFLIAGILTAITALAHCIGGEITTIRSLYNTEINKVPRLELRAVWHMFSVQLFASAIMLFFFAFSVIGDVVIGRILALLFLSYGLTILITAFLMQVRLFQVPQWVVLFLIAGLTYWGTLLSN